MANKIHISQYSPRQRELFIQKSTRVATSYLRRAESLGDPPEALRPFFDVLGRIFVDLQDAPRPEGMKTVGTYCVMVPSELIWAAGAMPVRLCSGSYTACHGLTVMETELEGMLYEILSKQAQVILNVANLANAGRLDVQLARQAEYNKRIESCLDQKRVLYEQLILKQITMEDYKSQKAAVDSELDRLREIHSDLKVRTSQMEMDEKAKNARTELAREVVGAGGLTAGLADTLIDRVYVYPNHQVEIVWKMKDFCMEVA